MGALFSQGTSVGSTNKTSQAGRVGISKATGKSGAGGMPGYIKTGQDKSSGKAKGGATITPKQGPRSIGMKKGSRAGSGTAKKAGGSMDRSYFNTSTDKAGTLHNSQGGPKKPASRSASEMETGQPAKNQGRRGAVSMGGVHGAAKLPKGGALPGKAPPHTPGAGHKSAAFGKATGSATRQKGGGKAPARTGGTMESMAGRGKYTKSGSMTARKHSMFY